MAAHLYEASFLATFPKLRARDAIVSELAKDLSGSGTDATASTMAAIELHLHDGRMKHRQGRYRAAIEEFLTARALIYGLLYPGFNASYYASHAATALPISPQIERDLMTAASRIVQVTQPKAVAVPPAFWPQTSEAIPEALVRYTTTGFHEVKSSDEALELANARGVALLQEGRPEAAIGVMRTALEIQSEDVSLRAALELNLAAAHAQVGRFEQARDFARRSQESFTAINDALGVGQAAHVEALSTQGMGQPGDGDGFNRSRELLRSAAAQLPRQVTAKADGVSVPITVNSVQASPTVVSALGALSSKAATGSTKDALSLQPLMDQPAQTLTFRMGGRDDGWGTLPVRGATEQQYTARSMQLSIPAGDRAEAFEISASRSPAFTDFAARIYDPRVSALKVSDIGWSISGTPATAVYLAHLYGYVLPVALGDAYRAMGLYAKAEESYRQAAAYSYLNLEYEGTALWIRLGRNTLEWANSLYKGEDFANAKLKYATIIADDGTVPSSFLYATTSLSIPANEAKALITALDQDPAPTTNWEIADVVFTARGYQLQLAQGLDFYGLLLSPIHTFEYLQNVARGFATEAIEAEREFVSFKMHEEAEQATRLELQSARALAQAEARAQRAQYEAAHADTNSAMAADDLANKRAADAEAQRQAYQGMSESELWMRAASQAVGGGEDASYSEIRELADKLDRGESIEGPGPKLAAASTFRAGRMTRDYELRKMQDNVEELSLATDVTKSQVAASEAREKAARLVWRAAQQKAKFASAALEAFDGEYFTPDAWSRMADVMREISRNYLYRATRIAKLMERSYNFENDTDLNVIKSEYGNGMGAGALLGADSLRQDIESFTFHAITTKTRKTSRLKDRLSIATLFPGHFEDFRRTGRLTFETDLYEFDRLHPGFWGQRVEAVELELVGLLSGEGLHGTLSAGGATSYRKRDGSVGTRVHAVDTAALSNFTVREDGFLYEANAGVRGLFQGMGLGGTWQVHLPRRGNDMDFRRVFDINLIVYYTAQFDAALKAQVLALPPRPGELSLQRDFGLRYDFPDAWYAFYRDGVASFALERARFPTNQQSFKTSLVTLRVVTKPGVSNQGVQVKVTVPGGASGTAITDVNGGVSSSMPELAALAGGDPLGEWKVEVLGGAALTDNGRVKFDRVYNIQLGVVYSFEYVPEEL